MVLKNEVVAYVDQQEDARRLEACAGPRTSTNRLQELGFEVSLDVRFGDAVGSILDLAEAHHIASLTYGEQAGRLADIRVGAIMNRDVVAVAPETPLAEAARLLRDLQCGVLPVIADAAVVGTLRVRDLVALLGRTVANSS